MMKMIFIFSLELEQVSGNFYRSISKQIEWIQIDHISDTKKKKTNKNVSIANNLRF